eukprot:9437318-Ditylum_brightwellii.AAC.1
MVQDLPLMQVATDPIIDPEISRASSLVSTPEVWAPLMGHMLSAVGVGSSKPSMHTKWRFGA